MKFFEEEAMTDPNELLPAVHDALAALLAQGLKGLTAITRALLLEAEKNGARSVLFTEKLPVLGDASEIIPSMGVC